MTETRRLPLESQSDQILAHLQRGRTLTQLDALNLFGCFRLGARIWDLRRRGHRIESRTIETPSGKSKDEDVEGGKRVSSKDAGTSRGNFLIYQQTVYFHLNAGVREHIRKGFFRHDPVLDVRFRVEGPQVEKGDVMGRWIYHLDEARENHGNLEDVVFPFEIDVSYGKDMEIRSKTDIQGSPHFQKIVCPDQKGEDRYNIRAQGGREKSEHPYHRLSVVLSTK